MTGPVLTDQDFRGLFEYGRLDPEKESAAKVEAENSGRQSIL
jgi:hypothetical protein